MIHHLSIPAQNPLHVATVLAEIWEGHTAPFPSYPNSYVVLSFDRFGTMIEVYPEGTEMIPGVGEEQVHFSENIFASPFTATHAAISVPTTQAQIEAIARRESWRVLRCDRGFFDVIELWIENRLLLELLPPEMAHRYLELMQPENLKRFLEGSLELAQVYQSNDDLLRSLDRTGKL